MKLKEKSLTGGKFSASRCEKKAVPCVFAARHEEEEQ